MSEAEVIEAGPPDMGPEPVSGDNTAEENPAVPDVNGHDEDDVDSRRESVVKDPPSVAPKPKRPSCMCLIIAFCYVLFKYKFVYKPGLR